MAHHDASPTQGKLECTATQLQTPAATSAAFFELRTQRLAAFEREYLLTLLERHRGDISGAAREAQLPRGTVYRLLKKHSIDPKTFRTRELKPVTFV